MDNEMHDDAAVRELLEKAVQLYGEKRFKDALDIYYQLSIEGYTECQTFLGWMYFAGEGTEKNFDKAAYWYQQAANSGDPEAMFYLGKISTLERRFEDAFHHYQRSAERGYSPAIYKLACKYELGQGTSVDRDKAFMMFEEGAERGHVFALKEYGYRLVKGKKGLAGIPKGIAAVVRAFVNTIKLGASDSDSPRLRM